MRAVLILSTLFVLPTSVFGTDAEFYLKHVKPVLQSRCYSCHGSLKQEGGLRVDTVAYLLQGGDSGAAIVAGKLDESLILDMVIPTGGSALMPGEGPPLKKEELNHLRTWIKAGAVAPSDELASKNPREHWAFLPPEKSPLPKIENADWNQNPIDRFIAARHKLDNLTASEPAKPDVLLRRLFLDLTGVPPSREELAAFQADPSDEHYRQIVDRLLSSPRYGERWGRHWMDVWRYSDWDGYQAEVRESQPHIWRWRDWIIESLNDDKPYDRMIEEMLAGDELAPDDPQVLRATGFLVRNWFKFNRNVWLDNSVEHTGKAFLALTVNCAKCHDHMYDPIPQTDFYAMRAFFEPHDVRTDRIPGVADTSKDGLVRVYDAHRERPTYLFVRGNDKEPLKENPLDATVPTFFTIEQPPVEEVSLEPEAFYPALRDFVREETLTAARNELKTQQTALAKTETEYAAWKQRHSEQGAAPLVAQRDLIDADFSSAQTERFWEAVSGEWTPTEAGLTQNSVGNGRRELNLRVEHPHDFEAEIAFKITGGNQWRSVGISFDSNDGNDVGAYLSAVAGGSKLQVVSQVNGKSIYHSEGQKALPVELNRDYRLKLRVRDQLVNLYLDDVLQVAFALPNPRTSANGLKLWTFDAQATFTHFRLRTLPADVVLVNSTEGTPQTASPLTEADWTKKRELAQALVDVQQTKLDALTAVIAADDAKYNDAANDTTDQLALAAEQAQWKEKLATLKRDAIQKEVALKSVKSIPESDKTRVTKLKQAETELAAAIKKRDEAIAQKTPQTGNYTPLGTVYPAKSSGRRLSLARWIANEQNPLTARVAVNHLWLRHFGKPLVDSMFDFGLNGSAPTHPKLLDWLAVEFMESGWSMKHLHRLIVTSKTYQQTSRTTEATREQAMRDHANRLLWKMNSRRMEAEAVRDSTLFVAGTLDETMFGPDLDPDQGVEIPRRSLYFRSSKEKRMTYLDLFDRANVVSCYKREETIVPQQALAQSNSLLAIHQSRILAGKLHQEIAELPAAAQQEEFLKRAFRQVLSREITADETRVCLTFLQQQAELLANPAELASLSDEKPTQVPPANDPAQRARENLIHVLLNHHDFVTIH